MQVRLRSLIDSRTRLLAAISHDLRTPLTLLRLRAETVENVQERDKLLVSIAKMDTMIGATLRLARDQSAAEPRRPTDITLLLQSAVDEMRSRDTSGVGLGLAIAQSIVQTHAGMLMLSNRPEGGLRATIVLPLPQMS